ncbi:MAG: hypothetical protein U9Q06_01635, partial [Nanoarchaeota archaeon]|nr:hypothetical protein [Nanoarchaeota archaeon]
MKSKNKKGFQESFTWIFAIFVGGLILIFAVFFAVKMIGTNEPIQNTKTSQELVAIFEKLQTGSEDEKTDRIELVKETRIYTDCSSSGDFGENRIQISERSSFGGDWSKKGGGVSSMHNQYLFAEEMIQGKDLYFLIIPFNMPYKTADMMIMYSQEYCFVNPPEIIEEFIEDLNSERTKLKKVHRISDCESEDVKVCFSNSNGCDVIVKD